MGQAVDNFNYTLIQNTAIDGTSTHFGGEENLLATSSHEESERVLENLIDLCDYDTRQFLICGDGRPQAKDVAQRVGRYQYTSLSLLAKIIQVLKETADFVGSASIIALASGNNGSLADGTSKSAAELQTVPVEYSSQQSEDLELSIVGYQGLGLQGKDSDQEQEGDNQHQQREHLEVHGESGLSARVAAAIPPEILAKNAMQLRKIIYWLFKDHPDLVVDAFSANIMEERSGTNGREPKQDANGKNFFHQILDTEHIWQHATAIMANIGNRKDDTSLSSKKSTAAIEPKESIELEDYIRRCLLRPENNLSTLKKIEYLYRHPKDGM